MLFACAFVVNVVAFAFGAACMQVSRAEFSKKQTETAEVSPQGSSEGSSQVSPQPTNASAVQQAALRRRRKKILAARQEQDR